MTKRSGISKVAAGVVAAGVLTLTSVLGGGAVHADAPKVSEVVATKLMDSKGLLLGDFDHDGDVDGRDFLVWQRGGSPTPFSASDLANWQSNYGCCR
jgi:hypothetical protein